MQYVNSSDVAEVMIGYDESEIDPEFIPYINRINKLQCVITCQSCIGHIPYEKYKPVNPRPNTPTELTIPINERPSDASEFWGYIALYVTEEMLETLAEHFNYLKAENWLWKDGSKLWYDHTDPPDSKWELFSITPNDSAFIVFAWDAKYWPKPAEAITKALEMSAQYLQDIS